MSVEDALIAYLDTARMLVHLENVKAWAFFGVSGAEEYLGLCAEAESIQLDLAVAAARAPYSAPSWLGGVR